MFLGHERAVAHHTGGRRHGQGSSLRCKWRLLDTGLRINHQESDGRMQLTTHRFRRQLPITNPFQNK